MSAATIPGLSEKRFDSADGKKEAPGDFGELEKSIFLVESDGRVVNRIDDSAGRSQFFAVVENSIECIHQKRFPVALAAKRGTDGQAPDERGGNHRIFWQFLCKVLGDICKLHGVLRKGVVPGDLPAIGRQNKRNRSVLLEVLARQYFKIKIERIDTAGKSGPLMLRAE